MTKSLVGLIMGSQSDWSIMKYARDILDKLEVPHNVLIVSAHRTPERMFNFAKSSEKAGYKAIIAGAGGAAHLPGMVAAMTQLPVMGVPIPSPHLQGLDSLLSIVQMPKGVPVATFAIGKSGAINAALYATQIVALEDKKLADKLRAYRKAQTMDVELFPIN